MKPNIFYQRRFTILLLTLIVFILFTPLIIELASEEYSVPGRISILIISTCWAAAAAFSVSGKKNKTTIIAILLMAVSLLLELFATVLPSDFSALLFHLLRMIYLAFIIFAILKRIFRPVVVTFDTISASLCIYLLMGALWGNIYSMVEILTPGSIVFTGRQAGDPNSIELNRSFHMLYFSFVTLSTVGYGDVIPRTTVARMFAVTEAIAGQIYLLVMVSRLVGLQVSQAISTPNAIDPLNQPKSNELTTKEKI